MNSAKDATKKWELILVAIFMNSLYEAMCWRRKHLVVFKTQVILADKSHIGEIPGYIKTSIIYTFPNKYVGLNRQILVCFHLNS